MVSLFLQINGHSSPAKPNYISNLILLRALPLELARYLYGLPKVQRLLPLRPLFRGLDLII